MKFGYNKIENLSASLNIKDILPVLALGFSDMITQIILLRETISIFYGNELVIGIILANWMLITGAGSWLGKFSDRIKQKDIFLVFVLIFLAILPIIIIFLLSVLKSVLFPTGSMLSIIHVLYISFIILLPFCLLSGFLFTFLSYFISEKYSSNLISKVYSWEAIGHILGGLFFSFILVYYFKTFQSLIFLMAIDLAVSFIISLNLKMKGWIKYFITALTLILLFLTIHIDLDTVSKKLLFKDQELVLNENTPYGNLVITKSGEQLNFFENNSLLFTTRNIIENEEDVHYAMVQHPDPQDVLLVSGGISGTIGEILKYNVNKIDYIEINPRLVEIGKNYNKELENEKINIIKQDARLFIKYNPNRYDVILLNLSEPTTAQINRFYTIDFFRELKKILNERAVVSLSLMSTANYVSEEARQINSVLYNTLKQIFKYILVVPGKKNYYLVSDHELNINIARLIEEKSIDNVYVNQYYIDDRLLEDRSKFILENLDKNTRINKDFTPVSYYQQLRYWLSYFKINYWILGGIILIIFIILISRLNIYNFGLFTGGFAASSIEVILLIGFQVLYGYVYHATGIIITLFMAGLAFGALFMHRLFPVNIKNYTRIQFGIGVYTILLPFILLFLKSVTFHPLLLKVIFYIIAFNIAILFGMLFSFASKIQKAGISIVTGEAYSADMFGAALGALLMSALIIPLLGLVNAAIIAGSLSFVSGTVTFMRRKT